jgi:opacity protein-like surface antigen
MDAMTGTVPGFGPVSFTGSTHEDFAWGIGAGVGFPIAPNIVLDVQYEYLDLGEVRSGTSGTLTFGGIATTAAAGPMKADLTAHTIQASFRVSF